MNFRLKLLVNSPVWALLLDRWFLPPLLAAVPGAPRRALEIGCGRGDTTRTLRRRLPAAEITATDYDEAQVALARLRRRREWRGLADRIARIVAVSHWGAGEIERILPVMLAILDEKKDFRYRVAAAEALGKIGEPAVDPLLAALEHKDYGIRAGAAEALGKTGSRRAVEPLIKTLGDEEWLVRMRAAHGSRTNPLAARPVVGIGFRDIEIVHVNGLGLAFGIGDGGAQYFFHFLRHALFRKAQQAHRLPGIPAADQVQH